MAKMTKNQLIDAIAEGTQVSKGDVKAVIEQMATVGYKELNESGEFVIPGFVKMSVVNKPATEARSGVNPFTKEPMEFAAKPASKSVKASPLKVGRPPELRVIPSHPGQAPPPAHHAPRDGISGRPQGHSLAKAMRCNARVAFCFLINCDCLTAKVSPPRRSVIDFG
jgi:DNA-binding protein HU-beta